MECSRHCLLYACGRLTDYSLGNNIIVLKIVFVLEDPMKQKTLLFNFPL
jgi:hypothetical protein